MECTLKCLHIVHTSTLVVHSVLQFKCIEKEKVFCGLRSLVLTGEHGVSFNHYKRWLVERAGVHSWYCTWYSAMNFGFVIICLSRGYKGKGWSVETMGFFFDTSSLSKYQPHLRVVLRVTYFIPVRAWVQCLKYLLSETESGCKESCESAFGWFDPVTCWSAEASIYTYSLPLLGCNR